MLGFHDESGISEKPTVRRTWSLKGHTPVIASTLAHWKNVSLLATIIVAASRREPKLFLKSKLGTVDARAIVKYLRELKRHLRGRKLLLFWDGLPAHRARIVKAFFGENESWLRAVRMPAYAPELNPPEYLWSAMKANDLGNLRPDLAVAGRAVRRSYRRIKKKPDLLLGFLKASGLFAEYSS